MKSPPLNLTLDKKTREFVAYIAAKRGLTSSQAVTALLDEAVERYRRNNEQ